MHYLHNGSKYSIIAIVAIFVYLVICDYQSLLALSRAQREFSKRASFNVPRERALRRDTCALASYLLNHLVIAYCWYFNSLLYICNK